MVSKKSAAIVAAEEISVVAADEVRDSSVAEVVFEVMGTVDEVGVAAEEVLEVAAAQTSPKVPQAFGSSHAHTRDL